jgi:hypothetical protein
MFRSIVAVVAGYLATFIGVSTFFALVLAAAFGGMPAPADAARFTPPAWLLWVELGVSPIIAVAGGYVCAWIARKQELRHGLALAGLMLLMGAISVGTEAGLKPLWSSIAVAALGVAGVLAGARLRLAHVRA